MDALTNLLRHSRLLSGTETMLVALQDCAYASRFRLPRVCSMVFFWVLSPLEVVDIFGFLFVIPRKGKRCHMNHRLFYHNFCISLGGFESNLFIYNFLQTRLSGFMHLATVFLVY